MKGNPGRVARDVARASPGRTMRGVHKLVLLEDAPEAPEDADHGQGKHGVTQRAAGERAGGHLNGPGQAFSGEPRVRVQGVHGGTEKGMPLVPHRGGRELGEHLVRKVNGEAALQQGLPKGLVG